MVDWDPVLQSEGVWNEGRIYSDWQNIGDKF